MIVMKFGGSSLADAAKIRQACGIILSQISGKPIVVLSAMGETTDQLIECGENALKGKADFSAIKENHLQTAKALGVDSGAIAPLLSEGEEFIDVISKTREFTAREKDRLVSLGERLSVRIVSAYLEKSGSPSKPFDSWDIGFATTSAPQSAEVLSETFGNIAAKFSGLKKKYDFTPVVTGFIGKDAGGHITTLGRGGSDLTASVIGAALGVEEIQYWKDVDGIMSADPKLVAGAVPITLLSFAEASEIAFLGAKILHPSSILPAMEKGIPVVVKNSGKASSPGTTILEKIPDKNFLVKAVTVKRNVTLVDIVSTRMLGQAGFLANVFRAFEEEKVPVDVISTSEISISMTVNDGSGLDGLSRKLADFASVKITNGNSLVSVLCNIHRSSQILATIFRELDKNKVNVRMISQGASKLNISLVVGSKDMERCARCIHSAFFPTKVVG